MNIYFFSIMLEVLYVRRLDHLPTQRGPFGAKEFLIKNELTAAIRPHLVESVLLLMVSDVYQSLEWSSKHFDAIMVCHNL